MLPKLFHTKVGTHIFLALDSLYTLIFHLCQSGQIILLDTFFKTNIKGK